MLINRRNMMMAGGGWKNPYVTDGLIHHWDAEWNAGGGIHDSSLFLLRDLVGTADMILDTACIFGNREITYSQPQDANLFAFCGGITSDIEDLPERGRPITNETVGTLVGGGGWSSYKSIFAYRNGAAFAYNTRHCLNFGRYRNSESSNGMTGGYGPMSSGALTLSYSSRTASYSEYYLYINGQIISASAQSLSLPSDAKVRILTASVTATMSFNTLRIYNRSLTAAEIAANYAIDKARFNLPDAT